MNANLFDSDNPTQEYQSVIQPEPFDYLDGYNDEGFQWARDIEKLIDLSKISEKDPLIISVAFAYVFSVFIHRTMSYFLVDYQDYFEDTMNQSPPGAWQRMHSAKKEIYSSLREVLHDPYKIYLTLHDSILITMESDVEDEDDYLAEPYNYNDLEGFGFVSNGFEY